MVVAVLLLIGPTEARAQVEVFGFQQISLSTALQAAGIDVPGRTPAEAMNATRVNVTHDVQLGAALGVAVRPRLHLELMWLRQHYEAATGTGRERTIERLDVTTTLYLVNVRYQWRAAAPPFRPYLVAGVGAAAVREPARGRTDTRLASALGAGVSTGDRVGLRLEGRVMPVYLRSSVATGRLLHSLDGVASYAVVPYETRLQFQIVGGVTVRF